MKTKVKAKVGDILVIYWLDSHTQTGWKPIETMLKTEEDPIVCCSVGHYLGRQGPDKKQHAILLMTKIVNDEDKDGTEMIAIPIVSIVNAYVLKIGQPCRA